MWVIDVSDSAGPSVVANVPFELASAVSVSGSAAFVSAAEFGLRTIDITKPSNPFMIASLGTFGLVTEIVVDGSIAYATDYQGTSQDDGVGTLHLIDVSDPDHPVFLSSLELNGSPTQIAVGGSLAAVTTQFERGFHIVDVSDQFQPRIVASLPGIPSGIAFSGRVMYLSIDGELLVYDMSNPANPFVVGSADTPASGRITLSGSLVYIGGSVFSVVDVSDTTNPTIVGSVDIPAGGIVAIAGSIAYVAAGFNGLHAIDVGDPANPTVLWTGSPSNWETTDVVVSGSLLYVTQIEAVNLGESWMRVSDVSVPSAPISLASELLSYARGSISRGVAAFGPTVYIADAEAGIRIIDISSCQPQGISELAGFEIVTGTLLGGGIDDLRNSDDVHLHTRSGFGPSFFDLHHMEMRISATTTVQNPTLLNLTIESRIDEPVGIAQIRLLNHNTAQFDLVGTHVLGTTDVINTIADIDAASYVDGAGNIELSIKHIVFVPFLAFTFQSFFDWVEIKVR